MSDLDCDCFPKTIELTAKSIELTNNNIFIENPVVNLSNKINKTNYKTITENKKYTEIKINNNSNFIKQENCPNNINKNNYIYYKKNINISCENNLNNCYLQQTSNEFINAFFNAYINHGSIIVSPDDINFQINLLLLDYINKNKIDFYDREYKEPSFYFNKLDIKTKDDIKKNIKIEDFFDELSNTILKNNPIKKKELLNIFKADYTTSTNFDLLLSDLCLCKSKTIYEKNINYFNCGIKNAVFLGELDDWILLKNKVKSLDKIFPNIQNWINNMIFILDNFINTYNNNVNLNFWNNIFYNKNNNFNNKCFDLKLDYKLGWIYNFCEINEYTKSFYSQLVNDIKINFFTNCNNIKLVVNSGFCEVVCENNTFRPVKYISISEFTLDDLYNNDKKINKLL